MTIVIQNSEKRLIKSKTRIKKEAEKRKDVKEVSFAIGSNQRGMVLPFKNEVNGNTNNR